MLSSVDYEAPMLAPALLLVTWVRWGRHFILITEELTSWGFLSGPVQRARGLKVLPGSCEPEVLPENGFF